MRARILRASAITAFLLAATVSHGQTPSPSGRDASTLAATLLENEETTLHAILFDGPGKGSPEYRASLNRYCAMQAFIRMAGLIGENRYKIIVNPETGTEAVVDTESGRSLLESRNRKLVSYDKLLDSKTYKTHFMNQKTKGNGP